MARYRYYGPAATDLEKWKRALADHRKKQRNKRGRRPGPPIVGVRIPPPPKRDEP